MQTYRVTLKVLSAFGTPLAGDTLFGQLCWALAYRKHSLDNLLKNYTEQQPFLVVSDAFPHNCLPLPTVPSNLWEKSDSSERKKLKKLKWIDLESVKTQPFSQWQKAALDLNEDQKDSEGNTKPILKTVKRDQPHNTLNRQTSTTGEGQFAPYSVEQVWYEQEQELDIYVVLDEKQLNFDAFLQALKDIGNFGFGRDASIGLGKFEVTQNESVDFSADNANAFLTLANTAPQGLSLNKERCFYQLHTRFGRHGGQFALGASPFKKPIILAKAGAVFTPNDWQESLFLGNGLSGISNAQANAVHQGYAPVVPILVDFDKE